MGNVIVAAIDPSLTSTAIAVGRVGGDPGGVGMRLFKAGPSDMEVKGRLKRWHSHAGAMLAHLKYMEPSLVLIEGYSYGSKGQAVLDIAEFGGVLRYRLVGQEWLRLIEIPPSQLKKFITGKGNVGKTQMVAEIAKRYGVLYDTNDEYDAFGLHLMAQCCMQPDLCRGANQKAIIEALKPIIEKTMNNA